MEAEPLCMDDLDHALEELAGYDQVRREIDQTIATFQSEITTMEASIQQIHDYLEQLHQYESLCAQPTNALPQLDQLIEMRDYFHQQLVHLG